MTDPGALPADPGDPPGALPGDPPGDPPGELPGELPGEAAGDAARDPARDPAGAVAADYAAHGFAGRLGFGGRPALLVVDVAMAYLDPASPLYAGVEDVLPVIARLLAAARVAGHLVVHTQVRYQRGGLDGGLFWRKIPALAVFEAGSPLAEPPPPAAPLPGEVVVVKQYASAFFGTSLASTLRAARIDTVVLAGLTTSGCVRASAVDALQHGFAPVVVREAVGDRHPAPHQANLLDLQAKYADVVPAAQALAALSRPPAAG